MSDVEKSPSEAESSKASASEAKPPEAKQPKDERPADDSANPSDVPQTLGLRVARGLLAPVLVLGAIGVHFAVNVPSEEVIASNRDQGAKAKDKKKGRSRGRPKAPVRPDKELNAAWTRWSVEPFEGEPIKGKWGRRQNAVLNKAVSVARSDAFRGAPERPRLVASGTQCRTIRCRVYLRSPFEHELSAVAEVLERTEYEGELLWRGVTTRTVDPPTPQSPRDDHYLEVILGVAVDGADTNEIVVAPREGEKRAPSPAAQRDAAAAIPGAMGLEKKPASAGKKRPGPKRPAPKVEPAVPKP